MGEQMQGSSRRAIGRVFALVAAVSVAICLTAASADAVVTHPYLETFGSASQPTFANPTGLAVNQSTGDVLVVDAGAGTVSGYAEDGTSADFSALGGNVIDGSGPGPDETPQGELSFGGAGEVQIAVDSSGGATDGNIYVTQGSNHLIDIFSAEGEYLGQLTESSEGPFGESCGVSVDDGGNIYVGDYGSGVHKFSPSGTNTANFATPRPCPVAAGSAASEGSVFANEFFGAISKLDGSTGTTAYTFSGENTTVSVDPGTGDVFAATASSVRDFDASGATEATEASSPISLPTTAQGVAVNGSTGNVYVSRVGHPELEVYGPAITLPDATTGDASEITNTTATISGTVNPAGTEASYQFEYGTTASYGSSIPVPPGAVGSDETDHSEEAELTGLEPATTYHYRIDGINSNGSNSGEDRTFTTSSPPGAETTGSPIRTATTARLEGRINPRGTATTYHFEYGDQGPCGANPCDSTEPVEAGSGNEIELVSQPVNGLRPSTSYHYRLIGDSGNEEGPSVGGDRTVTTRGSDAELTHGALPGPPGSDRAWEQVSLAEANDNQVEGATAISDNGDRVTYRLGGGAPGTVNGGIYDQIFSERTSSGWKTDNVYPPRSDAEGNSWLDPAGPGDLSSAVSTNYNSTFRGEVSYWRTSPQAAPKKLFELGNADYQVGRFTSTSANGRRVVSAIGGSHDPDHPTASGAANLFELDQGRANLVSLLPDGTVPSCGVPTQGAVSQSLFLLPLPEENRSGRHWVSIDGRFAFFNSQGNNCNGPAELYMRDLDADITTLVSGPPLSGPDCSGAFIKSTPGAVFFWTQNRLTPVDETVGGCAEGTGELVSQSLAGGDVYRYDLGTASLTCVTCVPGGSDVAVGLPEVMAEIAVAGDGSRVYFTSNNPQPLVPGAVAPHGAYRADVGSGDLAYIARPMLAVGESNKRINAITADGSVLIFGSRDPSVNAINGQQNGGTLQYYRYDDDDRSLTCVSCPQDGGVPRGPVTGVGGTVEGALTAATQAGPNATTIDRDGDFVFNTPTRLSPRDQNTATSSQEAGAGSDVYEWRDGKLLLISDGATTWHGATGPEAAGIDPSGKNAFFLESAKLTADAPTASRRLYNARVGGGFEIATPEPSQPCPLEICQGSAGAAPPPAPTPGSSTAVGPGNLKHSSHRRHHKKHGRHHRKHKHGCKHNKHGGKRKHGCKKGKHKAKRQQDSRRLSHYRRASR